MVVVFMSSLENIIERICVINEPVNAHSTQNGLSHDILLGFRDPLGDSLCG